jgi:tetratricopeptide (TPR) repeat protein
MLKVITWIWIFIQPLYALSTNDCLALIKSSKSKALAHDYQGAIDDISMCIKYEPNFALAYYMRGEIYLLMDNDKLALQDLNTALRLNSESIQPLKLRCQLRVRSEEWDLALLDINRVIKLNPTDAYSYNLRAQVFLGMNKMVDAKNDWMSAVHYFDIDVKNKKNLLGAYIGRGSSKEYLGDIDGACNDYSEAQKLGLSDSHLDSKKDLCK